MLNMLKSDIKKGVGAFAYIFGYLIATFVGAGLMASLVYRLTGAKVGPVIPMIIAYLLLRWAESLYKRSRSQ